MASILPLLIIPLFYVLVLAPQRKKVRQQQSLIAALTPGTRVMLTSGIYGILREVGGDTIRLEVAPGAVVEVAKGAIARRVDASDPQELGS